MKCFFGILVLVLVAMATAEELKRPEQIKVPSTTETTETPELTRNKRGFILSTYTAPIAALPVAVAATEETAKKPEIANLPVAIETATPVATRAYAGVPIAYTYSAAVPYAYPAYRPYVPYYHTYPAFYY